MNLFCFCVYFYMYYFLVSRAKLNNVTLTMWHDRATEDAATYDATNSIHYKTITEPTSDDRVYVSDIFISNMVLFELNIQTNPDFYWIFSILFDYWKHYWHCSVVWPWWRMLVSDILKPSLALFQSTTYNWNPVQEYVRDREEQSGVQIITFRTPGLFMLPVHQRPAIFE